MKRAAAVLAKMLVLLVCLSICPAAAEYEKPTPLFYAADYAGVLSEEYEQYFVDQGAALQKATGAQIVVAAIPSLQGETIEEYANALFRSWGIGDEKENNGLLILLAVSDRKIRTEVGYGLEGALNDAKTGRLTDAYAIPYLREDAFDEGIFALYNAYLPLVYEEYGLQPPEDVQRAQPPEEEEEDDSIVELLIILAIILVLVSSSQGRHGGRGGRGGMLWRRWQLARVLTDDSPAQGGIADGGCTGKDLSVLHCGGACRPAVPAFGRRDFGRAGF